MTLDCTYIPCNISVGRWRMTLSVRWIAGAAATALGEGSGTAIAVADKGLGLLTRGLLNRSRIAPRSACSWCIRCCSVRAVPLVRRTRGLIVFVAREPPKPGDDVFESAILVLFWCRPTKTDLLLGRPGQAARSASWTVIRSLHSALGVLSSSARASISSAVRYCS